MGGSEEQSGEESFLLFDDEGCENVFDDEGEECICEMEEVEEVVVGAGTMELYGSGLFGSVSGSPAEFFVQINRNDYQPELDAPSQLMVSLRPRVNKMKMLGSSLKPPSLVQATVATVPTPEDSPNALFRVLYESTFASSYQVSIELPKANISHSIPSLMIEPGYIHPKGCSMKGAGIRGGVSEMPSSFRLLLGDEFMNPLKRHPSNLSVAVEFTRLSEEPKCDKEVIVTVELQNDKSYLVSYIAPISGNYEMSITLDSEPLEESPFTISIVAGMAEKQRLKTKKKSVPKKKKRTKKAASAIVIPKAEKKDLRLVPYGEHLSKLILIQSAFRRYLVHVQRKRIEKRLSNRAMIVKEILSTEATYTKNLELLINSFLLPLKTQKLIKDKEINYIFGNVEYISAVNQELMGMLTGRIAESRSALIGDVFIGFAPQLKSAYSLFINNYNNSLNTLTALDKAKSFQRFLDDVAKNEKVDIMSLLILPIQRLPRYELFFRELLRFTEVDSPDYADIKEAMRIMKEVNHFVNEEKRNAERMHRLLRISRKMYNLPQEFSFFNLEHGKRDYKGQGPMDVIQKSSTMIRQILVFTDALVVARKQISPNRGSRNLSFRFLFYFDSVKITVPKENCLKLIQGDQKIVLVAKTKDSKQFLASLIKVMQRYQPEAK